MFHDRLQKAFQRLNSLLCVGLDTDIRRIPGSLSNERDPVFAFNRRIVDTTAPHAVAFKIQIAYYAASSSENSLSATVDYIHQAFPNHIVILDAKRGDIGSTAEQYATEIFTRFMADAVTLNPYMGGDTLVPFLKFPEKGSFILCRTSNPGSSEFQNLKISGSNQTLFETVAHQAATQWNENRNVGLVVGATYPADLAQIRRIAPSLPFLVPGIGAQGGDLEKVVKAGCDANHQGILINSSRSIIYAADGPDFAVAAANAAKKLNDTINQYRIRK